MRGVPPIPANKAHPVRDESRIQGLTEPARRRDNARAERARRARRHCPPFQMTMDVHPSRTAVTCLHRVAAAKIEPTRGDRARPAGTRLD